jgi:hypothetical protein
MSDRNLRFCVTGRSNNILSSVILGFDENTNWQNALRPRTSTGTATTLMSTPAKHRSSRSPTTRHHGLGWPEETTQRRPRCSLPARHPDRHPTRTVTPRRPAADVRHKRLASHHHHLRPPRRQPVGDRPAPTRTRPRRGEHQTTQDHRPGPVPVPRHRPQQGLDLDGRLGPHPVPLVPTRPPRRHRVRTRPPQKAETLPLRNTGDPPRPQPSNLDALAQTLAMEPPPPHRRTNDSAP